MNASRWEIPFQHHYAGLLANRMKPELARLTLARPIATITLTLWENGGRFDAKAWETESTLRVKPGQSLLLRVSVQMVVYPFSRRSGVRVSIWWPCRRLHLQPIQHRNLRSYVPQTTQENCNP
jgi:hypothetical protein